MGQRIVFRRSFSVESKYSEMIDITHKIKTLRKAIAMATVVVSRPETIAAVQSKTVPKGDVLECSRVAALFAVKRTSDMIPDCHPLPVEFTGVRFAIDEMQITVEVEVHTIYRTGVEVEAMHGASVAALTIYDMLKPIDKDVEIRNIRLSEKKGGKSDAPQTVEAISCAVIVCSDSVASGTKEDTAGKAIVSLLKAQNVTTNYYAVIPDEKEQIQNVALRLSSEGYSLVLFTGGTGLSPRDVTPDAIAPLLDRDVPGIMEAARSYGQERTPYAMLSRGVAGFIGNTLIVALPGSTRGAEESMRAIFPYILHLFKVAKGMRHD